ncbi:uncharacterized protein LOC121769111 [Salvia splendens]|uniref:uncharacterized protein LOC121769111 n=1 Tax=Salvia splendens TaxID=180675 RepID=UPI001C27E583|nr:uncharacterized protein LOC121769111 [Salvia splendens]
MMKEIQENRTRSEENESKEKEAEEEKPLEVKQKSEAPRETIETVDEEESITTPPDDKAGKEILEEAHDEPQEKGEEVIGHDVGLDNTLFYLQSEKVHVPNEKVDEFTIAVKEESTPTERPPLVIDESERCGYEEEKPELKGEERSRRKAARDIYWVQLQPWPEPLRMEKPPYSGLRPKEKKKIQRAYKNHKKKRGAMVMYLKKIVG